MSDWIEILQRKASRIPESYRKMIVISGPIIIVGGVAVIWIFTSFKNDILNANWKALQERVTEISESAQGIFNPDRAESDTEPMGTRTFLPGDGEDQPTQKVTPANTPTQEYAFNEAVLFQKEGLGVTVTGVLVYNDRTEIQINAYNSGQFPYSFDLENQFVIYRLNERFRPLSVTDGSITIQPESMGALTLNFLPVSLPFELRVTDTKGNIQTIQLNAQ